MRRFLVPSLALLAACNHAPEGLVITLGAETAKTTDALDLDVVTAAVDPNKHDQVGLSVAWFKDDVAQNDLDDVWIVPPERTAKGQVWRVEVIATDSVLSAEPVAASIAIENSAPTAKLVLSTKAPRTDADLSASLTTEDADGDALDASWSWTVDGVDSGVTEPTVPAALTGRGQVWVVSAVVSDGEASSTAQTAEVTIRNTVPSLAAARTSPSALREETIATCEGAAWEDADPEDPETYEVTWTVNGAVVSTEPTLDGSSFDRGDSVTCTLTPVDNESAGDPVTSAAVVVRNTGPRVVGPALDPGDPTATDDLIATFETLDDPDGDNAVAIYAWYVDDVEVSTASFLPADMLEKGQYIYVRITGYDGRDYGTPTWAWATIANTPPTAPVAGLPETATPAEDLLCAVAVASTDVDHDSISYSVTWTVDGAPYTGGPFSTTWVGDTVPASDTSDGESWTCELTPDDGDDAGPSASATVVVGAL